MFRWGIKSYKNENSKNKQKLLSSHSLPARSKIKAKITQRPMPAMTAERPSSTRTPAPNNEDLQLAPDDDSSLLNMDDFTDSEIGLNSSSGYDVTANL